MPLNTKAITVGGLAAASATNIAASQSGTANTPLTLNGSTVTAGVATLDVARRVGVTSAGSDTGITWTVKGTDRYGRPQTDTFVGAGAAATAQSNKDFLTITSITPSGNTASTVTAGTTGTASSDAYIVDWVPNGNLIGCNAVTSGAVTYSIEECYDDFAPAWDQANNSFNWVQDATIKSTSASAHGQLAGPFTAIRVTVNSYSGSGGVTVKFITPFIGGAI